MEIKGDSAHANLPEKDGPTISAMDTQKLKIVHPLLNLSPTVSRVTTASNPMKEPSKNPSTAMYRTSDQYSSTKAHWNEFTPMRIMQKR